VSSHRHNTIVAVSISSAATNSNTNERQQQDFTRPNYVVEPIPIRIGHGFDIHRMAPIEEAGQPLIIAGVIVEHSNQKWLDVEGKYVSKGNLYETQLGVVAHSDGVYMNRSIQGPLVIQKARLVYFNWFCTSLLAFLLF
jgi:2-C-methyl-D-erythritol 2,4-cyclodiphosphate synthase